MSDKRMQNFQLDNLSIFEILKVSPYTPYLIVLLCFLILVTIQVRKVRGRNRKRRFILIETQEQKLQTESEPTSHAITFEGEVISLNKMIKRQLIEIRCILFFLPLFFFSILLVIFLSPLFWPIPFISLIGVFIVTMLGATRMLKYGNRRSYLSGKDLLNEMLLNESKKNRNFEQTILTNQVELENFFDYLSCETRLKLDDRVSSTWTLYVGLRAIKICEFDFNSTLFSVDKKGVKIPSKLRESISDEDIKRITDFFVAEDEKKSCLSIESWEKYLIAKIRFAIKEPQRVTNARTKWLNQGLELLEEFSTKILQHLQN